MTLFIAIVFLAFSSGCTSCREYFANGFKVGPNYSRPAAPVAEEWIDDGDPALDTELIQDEAWWHVFNDPVLDSLITTAHRQNLTLRVAGLRILEARAQRAIAAGNLFPQGQEVSGDYTRIGMSKNSLSGSFFNTNFDQWTLGGGLAWELDFWGRFRRAIEAADANLDASVENYDHVLVLLLSDVAQSYVNVRITEQRLAYARQNIELQRGSLRLAEERLRHGITTRLDVTQAVSSLAQTESSIRPLEAARRQAVNQLCILMGMPPRNLDEMLADHNGIPKTPAQVAIGIPAELLRRRPDVRRAEREVAAQSAMIGVATSELYPHFSINGTIYLEALEFKDLFSADSLAGAVGPAFRWNILNYGRLANNIRVQEARFQQLAVHYQNVVLQANAEAENAIINYLKTQQEVESLAESTEAARQSVELVSAQYSEGTVDFNRVFDTQRFLTLQQDRLAVAEGSIAQHLIAIYKALGGGWQIRLGYPETRAAAVTEQPAAEPDENLAPLPPLPPPSHSPVPPARQT
ncbi:MAG: efflux transporter outer membrane subunit [Pirellulaceae bacterium]|nr:efflux transporter outer membrane subunit [Pirellulaceae bacterium]